jgi:hypothetical protein
LNRTQVRMLKAEVWYSWTPRPSGSFCWMFYGLSVLLPRWQVLRCHSTVCWCLVLTGFKDDPTDTPTRLSGVCMISMTSAGRPSKDVRVVPRIITTAADNVSVLALPHRALRSPCVETAGYFSPHHPRPPPLQRRVAVTRPHFLA